MEWEGCIGVKRVPGSAMKTLVDKNVPHKLRRSKKSSSAGRFCREGNAGLVVLGRAVFFEERD